MRMLFLACLWASVTTSNADAPTTRKRGFEGFIDEHSTCDDAAALRLEDSWFYTWTMNPSKYNKCGYDRKLAAEFVPMVGGIHQTQHYMTDSVKKHWLTANVHYLLGYNEPDSGNG